MRRMTREAFAGPSLEVVKTEFLFHMLVSMLADPTRLYGGCQGAQVGLAGGGEDNISSLPNILCSPISQSLVPVKMLLAFVPDRVVWSVGDPHRTAAKRA